MSRRYGFYVRIKKNLPQTIFTIPTVGQFDISLHRPTMTNPNIANHGHCRQKCPSRAPEKALGSAPMSLLDRGRFAKPADIILWGVEGVYDPQNTLMLWQCINARTKDHFEGQSTQPPLPKLYPRAGGGCCPSIWCVFAGRKASWGMLGGYFHRWWPWLWCLLWR
jgi:hypothetical protein